MSGDPVAFRTFAVDPPHAVPTMLKRLNAAKVEQAQQVVAGYAQDWPDYKRRIGIIEGLDMAIAVCREFIEQERS